MANHSQLDSQVAHAWNTKKFTDGSKIELGRVNFEQAFIVTPSSILEVEVTSRGMYKCSNGRSGLFTKFDYDNIRPNAGGHTHPKGRDGKVLPYPGPNDGAFAKMTRASGKPTYVLSSRAAYKVEYDSGEYRVSIVAGKKGYSREIRGVVKRWLSADRRGSAPVNTSRCDFKVMTKDELR